MFLIFLLIHRIRSEIEQVINWMPEILFASQIAFCGLHRCVSEQKLNLLQFTAAIMAQLGTGSPQIMRGDVLQSGFLAAGSDHVPDNVLRDTMAPHLPESGNCSKDFAPFHASGSCPLVQSGLDPCWNWHRADVATFADQIDHGPVALTHLDIVELQANQFRSAETATEQHGQHRVIALGTHRVSPRMLEDF